MEKFEATAEVGDTIKCYDFQPMEGRADQYVVGRVVEKGFIRGFGVYGYRVEVLKDTVFEAGARTEIVAPFEMMILEFEDRITKIEAA